MDWQWGSNFVTKKVLSQNDFGMILDSPPLSRSARRPLVRPPGVLLFIPTIFRPSLLRSFFDPSDLSPPFSVRPLISPLAPARSTRRRLLKVLFFPITRRSPRIRPSAGAAPVRSSDELQDVWIVVDFHTSLQGFLSLRQRVTLLDLEGCLRGPLFLLRYRVIVPGGPFSSPYGRFHVRIVGAILFCWLQ